MINPNKVHRVKGTVVALGACSGLTVETDKGIFKGWVDGHTLKPGDMVNIQVSYSICLDQYVIRSARLAKSQVKRFHGDTDKPLGKG